MTVTCVFFRILWQISEQVQRKSNSGRLGRVVGVGAELAVLQLYPQREREQGYHLPIFSIQHSDILGEKNWWLPFEAPLRTI